MFQRLLKLALPIMLTNFLQTLYNLADTFFLGKLGKEALSAPSIAFILILFLIIFAAGFSQAGTTLISQSIGKGDRRKADYYLGQMTFLLLMIATALSAAALLSLETLLNLINVPPGLTYTYTRTYLRIIFGGVPFIFLSFILRTSLQAVGDSITPLKVQLATVSLNILLDYLLIFGKGPFPALGVAGAAWATVLARGTASAIGLVILLRGRRGVRLRLGDLVPRRKPLLLLLRVGLPTSLGQGISALGFTVLQGVVNGLGTAVIAAFGIGNRIVSLFNMPAQGLSQATTVLVGQELGAGRIDGARQVIRYALLFIFLFITAGMTLTFFHGAGFIRFFINDPDVTAVGEVMFRILSPSVIAFSLFTVLSGAFQGGGDTKPIMVLSIIRLWGIRVPAAWLLALVLGFGHRGIWLGMVASNTAVAVMVFLLYRTGRWSRALSPEEI